MWPGHMLPTSQTQGPAPSTGAGDRMLRTSPFSFRVKASSGVSSATRRFEGEKEARQVSRFLSASPRACRGTKTCCRISGPQRVSESEGKFSPFPRE